MKKSIWDLGATVYRQLYRLKRNMPCLATGHFFFPCVGFTPLTFRLHTHRHVALSWLCVFDSSQRLYSLSCAHILHLHCELGVKKTQCVIMAHVLCQPAVALSLDWCCYTSALRVIRLPWLVICGSASGAGISHLTGIKAFVSLAFV